MVNATSHEVVPVENACSADEPKVLCVITDETSQDWKHSRFTVNLPASSLVQELCSHVAKEVNYVQESFTLVWCKSTSDGDVEVVLNGEKNKSLQELGLTSNNKKNNFLIKDKDGVQPKKVKEDTDEIVADSVSNMFQTTSISSTSYSSYYSSDTYSLGKSDTGFVGLVNQAMTCYLNSLLQTLFMTPEFRNAIYRWEFNGSEDEEAKSIPFQLLKLFLHLQTSNRRAVETTDVTKSFGWDSSEAWQQHDVQELCRVMFDALESKFKNTDQDDLINKLYQGKLKDYVKCLQCGHESARTDTFLDIPLAVRPFGSKQGLGSVGAAIKDFVKPEVLDDTNQYFCEKCNAKCDAHKGLKFITFPYLLTLQLKRFAFDYATLHRVKLNDRMTFPNILDLNEFISVDKEENGADEDSNLKGDSPSSTETDSGVSEGYSDSGMPPEDEDMDTGAQTGNSLTNGDGGVDNVDLADHEDLMLNSGLEPELQGPYVYELFSIMIHSGSASGGHYYAYIRSFTNGQWYCFNDQSVSRIAQNAKVADLVDTNEEMVKKLEMFSAAPPASLTLLSCLATSCVYDDDIERTFGGTESSRSYYSAAYSSSTNAYMLMYRQMDSSRNAKFMDHREMPTHIKQLIKMLKLQEETERKRREMDRSMCKIKIFCEHPVSKKLLESKLEVHKDQTLEEAVTLARKLFRLEKFLPVEQCRIVKYDAHYEYIERSYDDEEEEPMGKVLCGVKQSYMFDLFLETRLPHETFPVYKPGGTTVKVHEVNLENGSISPPVNVRASLSLTVKELEQLISQKLGLPLETLRIVLEGTYGDFLPLENPKKVLKDLGLYRCCKVFVESSGLDDEKHLFNETKLYKVLDVYHHTIQITVMLPNPSRRPTEPTSRYICETATESDMSELERDKILHVDNRITLDELKKILEEDVGCSREYFKVYRVYSNNQEIEYSKLSDTLMTFSSECKLRVKYGRALKKDECQLKVYLLNPADKEPFKYLFDWIVNKGMSVRECKDLLHPEICQRCGVDVPAENLRMRRKNWKSPGTVYLDSQVFEGDIQVYASFEVCLEILEGPERKSSHSQLSLYVRHWKPSSLTLGSPKEVVLEKLTVEMLKDLIYELSGIPVENIQLTKGRGQYQFPYDVPLLEIHDNLEWTDSATSLGSSPLLVADEGAVLFYRDKTEELMEITDEHKKELMKKESAKTSSSTTRHGRFSYKERALKIYTDDDKPSKASA